MPTDAIEVRLRRLFEDSAAGIVSVYLYGSRARGTARPDSDVDLGILYREDPMPTLDGLPLDLEADLERAFGVPVQVVVLNRAPADLIHRVLRDGRVILDRDRSCRIRFEVKARNEFFDLQPILAQYRAGRAIPG